MAYIYILRCSDGTLYTGWTSDLEARVEAHSQGTGAKYTRGRRPVTLVYYEEHTDRTSARKREAEIKKMARAEKVALIEQAADLALS